MKRRERTKGRLMRELKRRLEGRAEKRRNDVKMRWTGGVGGGRASVCVFSFIDSFIIVLLS